MAISIKHGTTAMSALVMKVGELAPNKNDENIYVKSTGGRGSVSLKLSTKGRGRRPHFFGKTKEQKAKNLIRQTLEEQFDDLQLDGDQLAATGSFKMYEEIFAKAPYATLRQLKELAQLANDEVAEIQQNDILKPLVETKKKAIMQELREMSGHGNVRKKALRDSVERAVTEKLAEISALPSEARKLNELEELETSVRKLRGLYNKIDDLALEVEQIRSMDAETIGRMQDVFGHLNKLAGASAESFIGLVFDGEIDKDTLLIFDDLMKHSTLTDQQKKDRVNSLYDRMLTNLQKKEAIKEAREDAEINKMVDRVIRNFGLPAHGNDIRKTAEEIKKVQQDWDVLLELNEGLNRILGQPHGGARAKSNARRNIGNAADHAKQPVKAKSHEREVVSVESASVPSRVRRPAKNRLAMVLQ